MIYLYEKKHMLNEFGPLNKFNTQRHCSLLEDSSGFKKIFSLCI